MWRGRWRCRRRGRGWALLLAVGALLCARGSALAGEEAAHCPPCPPPPADCQLVDPVIEECLYHVNDNLSVWIRASSLSYSLKCPDGVALGDASLPRYNSTRVFSTVKLESCALPAEPLARALLRLNVRVRDTLELLYVPAGQLRADHFHDLQQLTELILIKSTDPKARLGISKNIINLFNPLRNLKTLKLEYVILALGVKSMENMTNLETLELRECRLRILQRKQLCKLPLQSLRISDQSLRTMLDPEVPCNMSDVWLFAMNLTPMPSFPAAKNLRIMTKRIEKFEQCSSLVNLTVIHDTQKTLPDGLVSSCGALRSLTLSMRALAALGGGALVGAKALQQFTLKAKDAVRVQLADNLFENTTQLEILKLAGNKLKQLPLDLSPLKNLKELDLSDNELEGSQVHRLQGLKLHKLWLGNNPLGDLCDPGDGMYVPNQKLSPLRSLTELRELSLAGTRARRVCDDWRRDLYQLRALHLQHNHIHELDWTDFLEWNRDVEVNLNDNNLTIVRANRNEKYHQPSGNKVTFKLGLQPLRCDCSMYWFAKAKREKHVPVDFDTLYCNTPDNITKYKLLDNFDLNRMVCPLDDGCLTNCSCVLCPQNDTIIVECSNRGLETLPNMTAVENKLRGEELSHIKIMLRVSNNNISHLPHKLSARLSQLDLRHNALSALDERDTRALLAAGRHVWLADNPLDCSCHQPLPLQLCSHNEQLQIEDLKEARCNDGRYLSEAVSRTCIGGCVVTWGAWAAWGALGGGAGAALLLAAGAALLLRRRARLRLKAFLLARGLCLRWVQPDDDDDCKYDAFLSYAHADAEVAAELQARLESGPRALRLCVHHRDWQPGEWIPAQIARSVVNSRRTIILLSENFAKSSWARAEFREAYAHALRDDAVRLIVVVLGAAPPADLDPDIRHFVSNNTYVRWGEPAFWDKLQLALPRGRPRPTPRAAPRKRSAPPPAPPAGSAPAQRRPPPLHTDLPVHPGMPQPPTPVVKFAHIDFPAPIKPAKTAAPACA